MKFHLNDMNTSMLLLHNSWTPKMFREMSAEEFLSYDCTLSNVLSEALDKNVKKSKIYLPGSDFREQNKYILHHSDGSLEYNPTVPGLNVTFKGTGGIVELYEPVNFEASNIICGTDSYISVKGSSVSQKAHGLNINATAKNSICKIGRDFSCWNIYITLIDEKGLKVEIGDDCMFSQDIQIRPSDAQVIFDRKTKKKLNGGQNITIGNHVWIGKNVLVCKGVELPDNTVVSAFSKVIGIFKNEYTIIGGIPSKLLKCDVDWDRVHPDLWENETE